MKKPDNSDGSRGQLTTGTDTCHLLQIQSPWTWIWETGQTHSFAAIRTYKERVPVVLRVPSASIRIFFASKTRIITSRAHSCVYSRPHRTDPGVLPSRYVSIMTFCRDDATREFICHGFVWLSEYTRYSSCSFINKIAPDWSNRPLFCRQWSHGFHW
jgi:hypothetical protein